MSISTPRLYPGRGCCLVFKSSKQSKYFRSDFGDLIRICRNREESLVYCNPSSTTWYIRSSNCKIGVSPISTSLLGADSSRRLRFSCEHCKKFSPQESWHLRRSNEMTDLGKAATDKIDQIKQKKKELNAIIKKLTKKSLYKWFKETKTFFDKNEFVMTYVDYPREKLIKNIKKRIDKMFDNRSTAIILAAGEGSRLYPMTKTKPKALVSFAGKLLIDRQLEIFSKAGISDVTVATGHCADAVAQLGLKTIKNDVLEAPYFKDGSQVASRTPPGSILGRFWDHFGTIFVNFLTYVCDFCMHSVAACCKQKRSTS